MERKEKTPLSLLFVLLALPHVTLFCPSPPVENDKNLTCYNDYNRNISCVWDSSYVFDHEDTVCTIYVERKGKYNGSCKLEPVDVSRPTLQKCSVIFKSEWKFQTIHNLSVTLDCKPGKQRFTIYYMPSCHIKLNPGPKPTINFTTISWIPQVSEHGVLRSSLYKSQLQWKQEDQSWTDPSVQKKQTHETQCQWDCKAELDPDQLIQDERYEARIRVKIVGNDKYGSTWSDWSPTASWVSPIGKAKPPSDFAGGPFGIVACMLVVGLCFFICLLIRTDKTTWIYIGKRIRGPPIPDPRYSFLQDVNNWLGPHFTSESFSSFLKPVEIISVEVTSTVDAISPSRPDAALLEKMRSESSNESTSSSFSNPSYSHISPPPPVSSLTAGNLAPCGIDSPYGPVVNQGEGENAEQGKDELRGKEVEITQLLRKGSNISEPMPVISDYEKVEKPQVERSRLQSLDSGMCSGEEISQESLEVDSISVTDSHDEGPEDKEEREEGNTKDFQKLFGGSRGIFDKGSIQVCSGYEQVQKLPADSPELPSLDSCISSGGNEQESQEESLEEVDKSTETTRFLFPPPSSPLACSLPSFSPLPLNFSGAGLSLQPLPSHTLERIALMSASRCMEPSGDGYMPVRQEQS
ncbi:uncharacterized protein LOC127354473 [Dicentrarchus labrax]|uniref:uncharacterized protein LOC127354473 n=1 Tax=Dicentrarchus labrax TaxID=13489 RepID=UPI0021F50881|nr:uncharacterized protein LOC127354473 [Dicentrarchus labrax]XP_051240354.1 uncharacterized protein LOC127354473 [Dicentrarchus labrax]XP_051240355.1 uncharacterized protein LOC127354473 [Dicentrarchus labrax]